MKLENKVAVVTGGAMGKGLGIVKVFLKYGAKVCIFDYSGKLSQTVEELKKDFEEAIDCYLEHCKANNEEPERQYKGSFNIRIEPELHVEAVRFANLFNMSLNQFVAKAIRDEIETCEKSRN